DRPGVGGGDALAGEQALEVGRTDALSLSNVDEQLHEARCIELGAVGAVDAVAWLAAWSVRGVALDGESGHRRRGVGEDGAVVVLLGSRLPAGRRSGRRTSR